MNKLIPAMVVAVLAPTLWGVQGTVSTDMDSKTGDIKWLPRAKTYTVSFKKGRTMVEAEFKLAEVTNLEIPKPDGFDKLAAQVAAGQGLAVIPALQKIVSEYRMLVWDKPAARLLTEAYLSANKFKDALDTAQKVVDEDKSAAYTGPLAPAYWRALFRNGRSEQVEKLLAKAASSGDRAASAEALVMRGDIILANGQSSAEAARKALAEAYLRVYLMYTDAPCADAHKTATVKAADCLELCGLASRAETLRAQVK